MLEQNHGSPDPEKTNPGEINSHGTPLPRLTIPTTRFGDLLVERSRIISVRGGLRGFPDSSEYTLLGSPEDPNFFWLQSLQNPGLAFVVTDPAYFFEDYGVYGFQKALQEIGLKRVEDAQVLVVLNKIDGSLTANLEEPILVNPDNMKAVQVAPSESKCGPQEPLWA